MDVITFVALGLYIFGFLMAAGAVSAAAYFLIKPYRRWFEKLGGSENSDS